MLMTCLCNGFPDVRLRCLLLLVSFSSSSSIIAFLVGVSCVCTLSQLLVFLAGHTTPWPLLMITPLTKTWQHYSAEFLPSCVGLTFPPLCLQLTSDEAKVYDTVIFDVNNDGTPMEQKLWPRHCVQNTWGAELHADLKVSCGDGPVQCLYFPFIVFHLQLTKVYISSISYQNCLKPNTPWLCVCPAGGGGRHSGVQGHRPRHGLLQRLLGQQQEVSHDSQRGAAEARRH